MSTWLMRSGSALMCLTSAEGFKPVPKIVDCELVMQVCQPLARVFAAFCRLTAWAGLDHEHRCFTVDSGTELVRYIGRPHRQ